MDIFIGFAVCSLFGVWILMAVIVARYIKKKRQYKATLMVVSNDYCMCGDLVSSHTFGSGHAPLSQLDFFMGNTKNPKYE